ncbi:MAG: HepT-like ribonuclease domain-containing protein [Aggregatilineales bacterium]
MPRDLAYLLDVLQAARQALEFIRGLDHATFTTDIKTHYAVIRCIEIIGEAVNRISAEFQADHADIPWSAMVGMRNIVIHRYNEVNLDTVWDTLQKSLPDLIAQITPLIPPDNPEVGFVLKQ